MTQPPILIVGVSATDLVLAISLARQGLAFRIIGRAAGANEQSCATVMHAVY
ncbi:MAG: hypothetical protein JWO24_2231 [Rhodospirillales bacterium]|jgi:2-polyprenyl-6-methoxyphenol hydroxylase-like FAD-dependent oxidoreductase|nr:hypothetical protein [Rhodospirillales bacterium]